MLLFFINSSSAYSQEVKSCGNGTVLDSSTGQCILQCGEGTGLVDGTCIKESNRIDFGQIEAIAVGIIGGLLATAFGIWWTVKTRNEERAKEDLEIIQNYGNQLSEITREEEKLETKLDCSLYAERYLDILDQMASLLHKKLIRHGVADYFETQFKYGRNLWYWYKKNVEKIPKEILDDDFKNGLEEFNNPKYTPSEETSIEITQDRWYYFRWWCCGVGDIFDYSFFGLNKNLIEKKKELVAFKPKSRKKLIEKRLEWLRTINNPPPETKKRIEILDVLLKLFTEEGKYDITKSDERNIYDAVIEATKELDPNSDIYKKLSPFVFIKRYSKSEQYGVLPDTMETDYDDIPDENGMSKFEVVETIQRFGEILNDISNKEKNLYSKLDCSLYVEQYLDTLEQIATLYHKKVIPKKAADYFENKFSYGINLFNWYNKWIDREYSEFDPTNEEYLDEEAESEERWRDFKWFCRGGDTRKNKITKFKDDEENENERKILPDVMYYYDLLPNEEGLKPSEVLEIMRNYGRQLTDLSGKESDLQTKIDCSVYVEQYLDTLEQIAYLFNEKSLATDAVTYFENNFTYGLTLKNWYAEAVSGADEQDERWLEFDKYCKNFKNAKGEIGIKEIKIGNILPSAMLYYNTLPADKYTKEYVGDFDYKLPTKNPP